MPFPALCHSTNPTLLHARFTARCQQHVLTAQARPTLLYRPKTQKPRGYSPTLGAPGPPDSRPEARHSTSNKGTRNKQQHSESFVPWPISLPEKRKVAPTRWLQRSTQPRLVSRVGCPGIRKNAELRALEREGPGSSC